MGYSTNHTLPFYSHYPNTPLGSSNGAIALRECVVFMGILNTILCTHSFSLSIFYSFFLSLSLSLTHSLLANTSALIPVMQNLLYSYYNLIFLLFLHYFILILALFTFSDNFKYTFMLQ